MTLQPRLQKKKRQLNNTRPQSNELRSAALRRIAVFGFWILVWQICSMFIGYGIFVASPWKTLQRLCQLCLRPEFWTAVVHTTARIFSGYLPAVILGILLAVLVSKVRWAAELLLPLIRMIRTVPVASFIILALILVSSRYLTQLISFLMAMPVICLQMGTALGQMDQRLEEMAHVFRVPAARRIRYLYLPQVLPALGTSMILALSFAWKSGIAAEVIGMPTGSIGERLQQAKVYLATPDLFAWTIVILLLSYATERLLRLVLRLADRFSKTGLQEAKTAAGDANRGKIAARESGKEKAGQVMIRAAHVTKAYGDQTVISNLSQEFLPGRRYVLIGASGTGKTTLLRLLAGLEKADEGILERNGLEHVCVLFQEDRLLEHLNAVENVHFTAPQRKTEDILEGLKALGINPEETEKPLKEWSGGMKRRAALLRTLLSEGDALLLDEPFQGLDAENREKALACILEKQNGRVLVLTAHGEAEGEALGADVIQI